MNVKKPLEILIIEDNPGDTFLISEFLRDTKLDLNITIAEDGQKALDLLGGTDRSKAIPAPDFIVLDLNLPKVHGYDVLAFIKGSPELRLVPVVVMTGSLDPKDELRSRSMGVTDFRVKPSGREELEATRRWFKKNLIPLVSSKGGDEHQKTSNSVQGPVLERFFSPSPKLRPHLTMHLGHSSSGQEISRPYVPLTRPWELRMSPERSDRA